MKHLKPLVLWAFTVLIAHPIFSQNFDNLHFGTDSTLDIVSWNLEHFPTNGNTTVEFVAEMIQQLNVDIVALQEIEEVSDCYHLTDLLSGYSVEIGNNQYDHLAYIYRTETITPHYIYEIFTYQWRPFPRSPFVFEFEFQGKDYVLINNHLKCCGDGILEPTDLDDEENRRWMACQLLKSYVEDEYSGARVMMVGDWNDSLDDTPANNVFQPFLEDTDHFQFVDYEIATGNSNHWSYPTWPSHLDHILINNELFPDFQQAASYVEVIKVDHCFDSWREYEYYVSDHRPVAMRLFPYQADDIQAVEATGRTRVYPNPVHDILKIQRLETATTATLEIFDILGQNVHCQTLNENLTEIKVAHLTKGIYFYLVKTEHGDFDRGTIIIR